MPIKHPRSVWGRTKTIKKGWAVLAKGALVTDEHNLCSLLIFDKKWCAENARRDHEQIAKVEISFSTLAKGSEGTK